MKRQCVAPTHSDTRCKNMVPSPKVICHVHKAMYQSDELHDGECDCTLCEDARSQPVGMFEFSGDDLLAAFGGTDNES